MTPRQRWLAAIRLEPVDRLPFWPKLDAAYTTWRRAPFDGMSLADIHEFIGSDRHEFVPGFVREARSSTSVETQSDGGTRTTVYRTASGVLTSADQFDHGSQSWHPVEFPVKGIQDARVFMEFVKDARSEVSDDALAGSRAVCDSLGESAVTALAIDESPLMRFVEWIAGVENAHMLLADYTDEVEELFDALHSLSLRRAELMCEHSPVDLLYMMENTSTTLISPSQYRRYCVPHLTEYGAIARRHDRLLALHTCGHLLDVLQDMGRLPVVGFEAFSSPPIGNTRFADGRSNCPDKCLIGGTNAVLWTKSASEIIAEIEQDLAVLPHHRGLAVTSGGVMPPMCEPETIKEVREWLKQYSVRR